MAIWVGVVDTKSEVGEDDVSEVADARAIDVVYVVEGFITGRVTMSGDGASCLISSLSLNLISG